MLLELNTALSMPALVQNTLSGSSRLRATRVLLTSASLQTAQLLPPTVASSQSSPSSSEEQTVGGSRHRAYQDGVAILAGHGQAVVAAVAVTLAGSQFFPAAVVDEHAAALSSLRVGGATH